MVHEDVALAATEATVRVVWIPLANSVNNKAFDAAVQEIKKGDNG